MRFSKTIGLAVVAIALLGLGFEIYWLTSSPNEVVISGSVSILTSGQAPVRIDFRAQSTGENYSAYVNSITESTITSCTTSEYATETEGIPPACSTYVTTIISTLSSSGYSIQLPNNDAYTITIVTIDQFGNHQTCDAGTLNLKSSSQ